MELVSPQEPDILGILVIAGCPTACADTSGFAPLPVWTLRGPEDLPGLCDRICERLSSATMPVCENERH